MEVDADPNGVISDADRQIAQLVGQVAPELDLLGVGPEVAGQLLTSAGDNPDRITSEAAFALLGGVAPRQPAAAVSIDTDSTVAATAKPTPPST